MPGRQKAEAFFNQQEAHGEYNWPNGWLVDDRVDQRHEAKPGQEQVHDAVDETVGITVIVQEENVPEDGTVAALAREN